MNNDIYCSDVWINYNTAKRITHFPDSKLYVEYTNKFMNVRILSVWLWKFYTAF